MSMDVTFGNHLKQFLSNAEPSGLEVFIITRLIDADLVLSEKDERYIEFLTRNILLKYQNYPNKQPIISESPLFCL